MPTFKKRNRIISFRVSDEEFEILLQVSEAQGAHSISDYARLAACRAIAESGAGATLAVQVEALESRVQQLSSQVERLSQLFDH